MLLTGQIDSRSALYNHHEAAAIILDLKKCVHHIVHSLDVFHILQELAPDHVSFQFSEQRTQKCNN